MKLGTSAQNQWITNQNMCPNLSRSLIASIKSSEFMLGCLKLSKYSKSGVRSKIKNFGCEFFLFTKENVLVCFQVHTNTCTTEKDTRQSKWKKPTLYFHKALLSKCFNICVRKKNLKNAKNINPNQGGKYFPFVLSKFQENEIPFVNYIINWWIQHKFWFLMQD